MKNKSIEWAEAILNNNKTPLDKRIQRIASYANGLCLSRNFCESMESFASREPIIADFLKWWDIRLKSHICDNYIEPIKPIPVTHSDERIKSLIIWKNLMIYINADLSDDDKKDFNFIIELEQGITKESDEIKNVYDRHC